MKAFLKNNSIFIILIACVLLIVVGVSCYASMPNRALRIVEKQTNCLSDIYDAKTEDLSQYKNVFLKLTAEDLPQNIEEVLLVGKVSLMAFNREVKKGEYYRVQKLYCNLEKPMVKVYLVTNFEGENLNKIFDNFIFTYTEDEKRLTVNFDVKSETQFYGKAAMSYDALNLTVSVLVRLFLPATQAI